jgi:hypothetical protein
MICAEINNKPHAIRTNNVTTTLPEQLLIAFCADVRCGSNGGKRKLSGGLLTV